MTNRDKQHWQHVSPGTVPWEQVQVRDTGVGALWWHCHCHRDTVSMWGMSCQPSWPAETRQNRHFGSKTRWFREGASLPSPVHSVLLSPTTAFLSSITLSIFFVFLFFTSAVLNPLWKEENSPFVTCTFPLHPLPWPRAAWGACLWCGWSQAEVGKALRSLGMNLAGCHLIGLQHKLWG